MSVTRTLARFIVNTSYEDLPGAVQNRAKNLLLYSLGTAMAALGLAHRGYVLETGNIVLQGKAADLANDESVKKAYMGQ